MRPRLVLITTTINVPHVLAQWAGCLKPGSDVIIVAGDVKSPHEDIINLLTHIENKRGIEGRYLDLDQQTRWATSDVVGWNSIQRRNIALLEAIQLNPKVILTIDDDNAPTGELANFTDLVNDVANEVLHDVITTHSGWFNPGNLVLPHVSHRGMPMRMRHVSERSFSRNPPRPIGVAEMLVLGDPDIDAVERIVNAPNVEILNASIRLAPGTWAPFNSQATLYRTDLAPLMMVWPGVGRYDDIWASYLARCVMDAMGLGVYYGAPAVHQERNEHDLMRDLDLELFGMKWTDDLVRVLRTVTFDPKVHDTVIKKMSHVYAVLEDDCPFLPAQTIAAFDAWSADLIAIQDEWRAQS